MFLHPRNSCFFLLAASSFLPSQAQNATAAAPTAANTTTTLHVNARSVVVDVVVTDGNRLTGHRGEPVAGLPKEDFQVFEQGKPQTITFFEEHKGTPAISSKPAAPTPNLFSNVQDVGSADAVNVILFDTLNTTLDDQAYVRAQVLKYVKGMQPGKPIAMFSLSAGGLRFLLGFTTDPADLKRALTGKRGGLAFSPLLRSQAEDSADSQAVGQVAQQLEAHPSGSLQGFMAAMMEFQARQKAFEDDVRVDVTLDALRQIARYLTGVPGRKNVIWFSSAFPLNVFANPSITLGPDAAEQHHEEEVRRTTNLLTAAQVAIYPVAAEGVENVGLGDTSGPPPTFHNAHDASVAQTSELNRAMTERNRNHATMDVIAAETGGEAFYNGNGFKEALSRVLDNGTHYYRIAYTPASWETHKGFRRIDVKLLKHHYQLAYRRGYLIEDEKKQEAQLAKADPLGPLMQPGMPDFTQIVYKMLVHRSATAPTPPFAGNNPKLTAPLQRYTTDLAVSTKDIQLEQTSDGIRHGDIAIEVIGYDPQGIPVNWLARHFDLELTPQRYAAFQRVGIQLHLEIDLPGNEGYLRTGIYDLKSQKAGTLEIPLQAVSPPSIAAK